MIIDMNGYLERFNIKKYNENEYDIFMFDGINKLTLNSVSKKELKMIKDELNKLDLNGEIDASRIKLKGVKTKIGYKIVRVENEKIGSAIWHRGVLEYPIGERVYRELTNGGLCVFNTLPNAVKFIREFLNIDTDEYRIYRCEYRPAKVKEIYTTFINNLYKKPYKNKPKNLPFGTRLARWVILGDLEYIRTEFNGIIKIRRK